jgi:hypothetical protein
MDENRSGGGVAKTFMERPYSDPDSSDPRAIDYLDPKATNT